MPAGRESKKFELELSPLRVRVRFCVLAMIIKGSRVNREENMKFAVIIVKDSDTGSVTVLS